VKDRPLREAVLASAAGVDAEEESGAGAPVVFTDMVSGSLVSD
jgi:hypothetical protein